MNSRYLTPPELAKIWRCKPQKIIDFIRSGELKAFDISANRSSVKPRYRIPESSITEFEYSRSGATKKSVSRPRKKKRDLNVIEYF